MAAEREGESARGRAWLFFLDDQRGLVRRELKQVPLPGLPHSTEFMDAYQTALGTEHREEINASRTAPGTMNALVVSYYKSDAGKNGLEEETRKTRRRVIEKFRTEHGDKRVALLQRGHVEKMLAEIERPSARRNWLKAIRGLMQAAIPTMRKDDPTAGIPGIKLPKSRGHRTWTDAEIEKYRAPARSPRPPLDMRCFALPFCRRQWHLGLARGNEQRFGKGSPDANSLHQRREVGAARAHPFV
jgi:hypothetical protein